ncbi:hypothetical protein GCM10010082_07700 [Kushneria pakistanensis]|uniref:Uncharacterized protein n=1 Tax=Kushneria pakistanensis TaxID=1508770 RepID=A0ABQ3FCU0_9GAMM|nr:hypothetical protein [Kushneria pakistanensis]GHC18732.1 hypothetical protein GCM10010082_07700 [Kushneria pakistanensis]
MPYRYQYAKAGEFTSTGENDHVEGFVVFLEGTKMEISTYTTEDAAKAACEELNQQEQDQ